MIKYSTLKDNNILEVIAVFNNDEKKIYTEIFTDGNVTYEEPIEDIKIKKYYIGKRKYNDEINLLRIRRIHIEDYSYVVTYLIAKENKKICNIDGTFDVIKNISIHLDKPNNKNAIKKARDLISKIESIDKRYSQVYSSLFVQSKKENIDYCDIKGVHVLKKNRR